MNDISVVIDAIEASWCAETCPEPDKWSLGNPAYGQCEVSSFVAWEHLGGELVLGKVHLDGEFVEHHYWNRIDGTDIDLTRRQFKNGETITEEAVLAPDFITANRTSMRPEVSARIDRFGELVAAQLGD